MKPIIKQTNKKAAFTIVELLTVMGIIVILIGLLVPSLNRVKRYARTVTQKAQFHSIEVAMDLFNNEFDGYPDSDAEDENGDDYCGAMKLCEAMVGQDLLGFHPDSRFRSDGTKDGSAATQLYPDEGSVSEEEYIANLRARRGPYLQLENANAYKLKNLYGAGNTGPLDEDKFVLCDVYKRVPLQTTGADDVGVSGKTGMPILYYKADTSKTKHNAGAPGDPENIYNYKDNAELVELGLLWGTSQTDHPLYNDGTLTNNWERFYVDTKNDKITTTARPYRVDSYILISAGFDGLYGTRDDIFNFGN